jgi:hypothetical protein
MHSDHLLAALLYTALAAAATAGAWLLTDLLGGAMAATLPVDVPRLF